jgi:hypothetical protein
MDVMAMPGTRAFAALILFLLFCSAPFFSPCAARSDGPSCGSHEFYGTVSNNGKVVGAGYIVTAVVNGQEVASATTDAQGRWGNAQPFAVASTAGSLIEFYINGVLAGSAASCIETNQLNIAVYGVPPPSGSAASTASSATASTSSVSATAVSQPALSSAPSNAPASSSTPIFYIGPQPASTHASPATIAVDCSLPGQRDSLTLSNGTLASAKELVSAGSAIELDFAANTTTSLTSAQQLKVEPLVSQPTAPDGSQIIAVYSFEPENSTFNPPVTLKLKYDRDKLPAGMDETSLYIAQLEQPGKWIALTSSVDKSSNTVSTQLSHFSVYGLIGRLTPVSSAVTPTANNSQSVPAPVNPANAETIPQREGTSPAPASAGQTSSQMPGMDIMAPGILIAGGILIIILLLAIIRRRPDY